MQLSSAGDGGDVDQIAALDLERLDQIGAEYSHSGLDRPAWRPAEHFFEIAGDVVAQRKIVAGFDSHLIRSDVLTRQDQLGGDHSRHGGGYLHASPNREFA